ncbi:phage scaffolding protein [Weissella cibaria]|uniref:phage scaffolding protein n=1 Tax=Bacilli TaxID=91061 RepID=UPI00215B17FC|nr:phage scaffolding protein [Weissella cibaria]MCR8704176.1 phage scaffolding protein [Weissella cibaria]
MDFKELLTKQGIDDEKAAAIIEAMQTEKIFTTTEENIEERFNKMKSQRDSAREELDAANALVDDLKKATDGNADAQKQIEEYKDTAEQLQGKLTSLEKASAVKEALTKAGATDVDYAMFKLGGIDALELKDGKVVDLENKVKELKETMPNYFNTTDGEPGAGGKADDNGKPGFQVLDNKLKNGNGDGTPLTIADRIAANMQKNGK